MFDPPSRDYLRWDGVLFDPKPFRRGSKWDHEKQNPASHVRSTPLPTSEAPPFPTSEAPKTESVSHVVHIQADEGVSHGVHISRVTTMGASQEKAPTSPPTSSEGSLEEESTVGVLEEKNNVVDFVDPRIAALEATEKKRRLP